MSLERSNGERGSVAGDALRTLGKAAGLGAAILVSGLTGLTMVKEKEINPITALATIKDDALLQFGYDFCPEGPDEAEFNTQITNIELATFDRSIASLQAEAAEQGLHFADPLPFEQRLNQPNVSALQVTEILNEYTESNFGFTFTLDVMDKIMSEPRVLPFYVRDAAYFLQYTSVLLPLELAKKIDLASLTVGLKEKENGNAGEYDKKKHTAYLAINKLSEPTFFIHEILGHGVHVASCRNRVKQDGALTSLNPDGFTYVGDLVFSEEANDEISELANANEDVVAFWYGLRSIDEDFATTVEVYFTEFLSYYGNPLPIEAPLTAKTALFLDRVDELAPGSARYLSSIRPALAWMINEQKSLTALKYDKPETWDAAYWDNT